MTTIDAERKAFEETFAELSDGVAKAVLERRVDGQYASIATNFAWKGWLARAQAVATAGDGVTDGKRQWDELPEDVVAEALTKFLGIASPFTNSVAMRRALEFALSMIASPSAPRVGVPEYTTEMGEAGQKYINSCVKNIQPQGFKLPALFRWSELLEAMLAVAPEVPRG